MLSQQLFSALMIMVIVTPFLAPPLLKWSIRRGGVTTADARHPAPRHPPETGTHAS